ncbi:uncharacterized protein G2W53_044372 [Senna tora]|uniref:Uncharacterized protein n=1 Tax=Senna tora TaxID=362788 RepID=A0A834SKE4_9FABA|nr:uncharacterized protein G2W53_044372 [Senna tora]
MADLRCGAPARIGVGWLLN